MIKKVIVKILTEHISDIICIYLFGSYIENRLKKESDIDIAILAEKRLDSIKRWEIAGMLADNLKKDVDLLDMNSVSTVMKARVVSRGLCIYESDKKKKDFFEMYTLSDYARLNEERKEIIERIKQEGVVYAR